MTERRKYCRRRTLLNGRIEIEKLNGWAVECTVRNISDTGARVVLPIGPVVPDRCELTISGSHRRPARLVWYRDGQAGFEMVDQRATASVTYEDCRRAPAEPPRPANAIDMLAARVAAIAAKPPAGHFTRP